MLWYKSWLETRWRFIIGLALVLLLSAAGVFAYPMVREAIPAVPKLGGRLGEMVSGALDLIADYRGYAWSQWFGKNLLQWWTILAVLLGIGGLTRESSNASALFTLALPVTRLRFAAIRYATGALELVVVAIAPSLAISALSPAIGETFPVRDAFIYGATMAAGGMAIYSFACLLSSLMADQWRPLLIALCVMAVLGAAWTLFKALAPFSLYKVMSAESYFFRGELPWTGLGASLAASAIMFYASARVIARKDF